MTTCIHIHDGIVVAVLPYRNHNVFCSKCSMRFTELRMKWDMRYARFSESLSTEIPYGLFIKTMSETLRHMSSRDRNVKKFNGKLFVVDLKHQTQAWNMDTLDDMEYGRDCEL